MRKPVCAFGILIAMIVAARAARSATVADFIDFSLRNSSNQVLLPGRLYIPPSALSLPVTRRPLMTMLHGGGGNGTDNLAQLNFISDGMIREADERGALIYAPQAPSGWSSSVITERVMTMIDRAVAERNVDNDRLFMMGYSNGGGGTWNMLSRYDGRFAAAIAMSGVTPGFDFVAARLVDTPIVAIHARDDATVSVSISRNVINGILAAGHEPLPTYLPATNPSTFFLSNANIELHRQFREIVHQMGGATDFLISDPQHDLLYFEPAGGGHTGLFGAFSIAELYQWMFAHTTAVPEPNLSVLLAPMALAATSGRRRRRVRFLQSFGQPPEKPGLRRRLSSVNS